MGRTTRIQTYLRLDLRRRRRALDGLGLDGRPWRCSRDEVVPAIEESHVDDGWAGQWTSVVIWLIKVVVEVRVQRTAMQQISAKLGHGRVVIGGRQVVGNHVIFHRQGPVRPRFRRQPREVACSRRHKRQIRHVSNAVDMRLSTYLGIAQNL